MTRPRILVTGGTGFLGKKVLPLLREKFEVDVLSRSGRTEVLGDLTQWNAKLDLEALKEKKYALFLHMAGLYSLKANAVDCNQHNISAMGIALKVADTLNIPYFINTSTVAAAINSSLPVVKPYDLNLVKPFPDAYSCSKAQGEQVLINWPAKNLRARVNLRLGVLVGDSKNGEIERIDGPYNSPEAFEKLRSTIKSIPTRLFLPGKETTHLPLVPVDKAAMAIVQFCQWSLEKQPEGYLSFHVTPKQGLGVAELYSSTLKALAISHKGISLVSKVPDSLMLKVSAVLAKFPEEELYYLLHLPVYDSTATREILGENWCPEFKEYENIFWSGYEKFISNR